MFVQYKTGWAQLIWKRNYTVWRGSWEVYTSFCLDTWKISTLTISGGFHISSYWPLLPVSLNLFCLTGFYCRSILVFYNVCVCVYVCSLLYISEFNNRCTLLHHCLRYHSLLIITTLAPLITTESMLYEFSNIWGTHGPHYLG